MASLRALLVIPLTSLLSFAQPTGGPSLIAQQPSVVTMQSANMALPSLQTPSPTGLLRIQLPPDRQGKNREGKCTATLVSPHGHLLTAGHCVVTNPSDASSARATQFKLELPGVRDPYTDITVLQVSPPFEFAVLKAPAAAVEAVGWRVLDPRMVRPGETLMVEARVPGAATACTTDETTDWLHFGLNCRMPEGASGAPLLSSNRIVGHVVASDLYFRRHATATSAVIPNGSLTWWPVSRTWWPLQPLAYPPGVSPLDPVPIQSPVAITVEAENWGSTRTAPYGEIVVLVPSLGPAARERCSFYGWQADEKRSCTLTTIFPQAGEFTVLYRAALGEDPEHMWGYPHDPSFLDEGWPAAALTVGAVDPDDLVLTGRADVRTEEVTLNGLLPPIPLFGPDPVVIYFEYGLSSNYDMESSRDLVHPPQGLRVPFTRSVSGLGCGTRYHYRAAALLPIPGTGETVAIFGNNRTFKTEECPPILQHIQLTTGEVLERCQHSAKVTWEIEPPNDGVLLYFEYRDARPVLHQTFGFYPQNATVARDVVVLSGLDCNTTYKYRLAGWTAAPDVGDITDGNWEEFTTLPCGVRVSRCPTDIR